MSTSTVGRDRGFVTTSGTVRTFHGLTNRVCENLTTSYNRLTPHRITPQTGQDGQAGPAPPPHDFSGASGRRRAVRRAGGWSTGRPRSPTRRMDDGAHRPAAARGVDRCGV